MDVSAVDVVLGSLVIGLAGWSLVQTGRAKPAGGGCGSGCGGGCGPGAAREEEGEPLVRLGTPGARDPGERR